MRLRSTLIVVAASLVCAATATLASNIPYFSGPPGSLSAYELVNQLIQTINRYGGISPGDTFPAFGGLQFALSQANIGTPSGSMAGYNVGDTIVLKCAGVSFATSPVIGVTVVSGGAVTANTVAITGITQGPVPSGSVTCSQSTTSGNGNGYAVAAQLGLIAAYISPASLNTGGDASNGNLLLNTGPSDGDNWPGVAGGENTFIGAKAGHGFTGQSQYNLAVGHNACGSGGTGGAILNTICLGTDAGRNIEGSGKNVLIGTGAGRNNNACCNTFSGYSAGGSGGANTPGTVSGSYNVAYGFQPLPALTSGAGNLCLGTNVCSTITSGKYNIVLSATDSNASDQCANGNESNVFAVCAGGGRVLAITGAGTPGTSTTTVSSSTISFPNITTAATTSCGSIAGAAGCLQFTVGGTTRYVPYY